VVGCLLVLKVEEVGHAFEPDTNIQSELFSCIALIMYECAEKIKYKKYK